LDEHNNRIELEFDNVYQANLDFNKSNANAAVSSKNPSKVDKVNGCFTFLLNGSCNSPPGKCKYSHDREVLIRTASIMQEKLAKSPFLKAQTNKPSSLKHISQENVTEISIIEDPVIQNALYQSFLKIYPESTIHTLCHRYKVKKKRKRKRNYLLIALNWYYYVATCYSPLRNFFSPKWHERFKKIPKLTKKCHGITLIMLRIYFPILTKVLHPIYKY
jgi:hypothetical protein